MLHQIYGRFAKFLGFAANLFGSGPVGHEPSCHTEGRVSKDLPAIVEKRHEQSTANARNPE
jgi:hypothetical protein